MPSSPHRIISTYLLSFVSSNIAARSFSFEPLGIGCKPSILFYCEAQSTNFKFFMSNFSCQISEVNPKMATFKHVMRDTCACTISIQSSSNISMWHHNGTFCFYSHQSWMANSDSLVFLLSEPLKFASKRFKISSAPLKKFPIRSCVIGCPPWACTKRRNAGMPECRNAGTPEY